MPGAENPLFTPGQPGQRKSHPKTPYPRESSPIVEEESEPEFSTVGFQTEVMNQHKITQNILLSLYDH